LIETDRADLRFAVWIDLFAPQPDEIEAVAGLGITVPSHADLRLIEFSRRIYRQGYADHITVALHQDIEDPATASMSLVCFILTSQAVVTVRCNQSAVIDGPPTLLGEVDDKHVFLSLLEAFVGSLADQLEGLGQKMRVEAH